MLLVQFRNFLPIVMSHILPMPLNLFYNRPMLPVCRPIYRSCPMPGPGCLGPIRPCLSPIWGLQKVSITICYLAGIQSSCTVNTAAIDSLLETPWLQFCPQTHNSKNGMVEEQSCNNEQIHGCMVTKPMLHYWKCYHGCCFVPEINPTGSFFRLHSFVPWPSLTLEVFFMAAALSPDLNTLLEGFFRSCIFSPWT